MYEGFLTTIDDILIRIEQNNTDIFLRIPEPIFILPEHISSIIGDNVVCISEFIIAKIQGKIRGNQGHPEITKEILLDTPSTLFSPVKIYLDDRVSIRNKYLFIHTSPHYQVVIEVRRIETGKTEINSIIPLGNKTLKQLENKFQAVYSCS